MQHIIDDYRAFQQQMLNQPKSDYELVVMYSKFFVRWGYDLTYGWESAN